MVSIKVKSNNVKDKLEGEAAIGVVFGGNEEKIEGGSFIVGNCSNVEMLQAAAQIAKHVLEKCGNSDIATMLLLSEILDDADEQE